jgi:hypothetical protein
MNEGLLIPQGQQISDSKNHQTKIVRSLATTYSISLAGKSLDAIVSCGLLICHCRVVAIPAANKR